MPSPLISDVLGKHFQNFAWGQFRQPSVSGRATRTGQEAELTNFEGERCLSASKVVTVNVHHFIYFHSRSHFSWERTEGKKTHVVFLFLFFLSWQSAVILAFAIPSLNTILFLIITLWNKVHRIFLAFLCTIYPAVIWTGRFTHL